MVKIRRASAAALAIGSLVAVAGCGNDSAESGDTRTLNLAHVFPDASAVHSAARALSERAPEVTDGRIGFEIFPGGQLGGDEELGASLASGDVDCAFFASTASGLDPRLQLSLLPYIATSYEAVDLVFFNPDGVLQENETSILAGLDITTLGYYENDFRGLTNNTRPIVEPSDLAGLSFRVPGLPMYVELFEAWDAHPVAIPFPELYTALQQGTVDGQDNGIVLSYNSRFQEVQQHLTLTRHAYGMGTLACNTGVWESLSPEDQDAVRELALDVAADTTQEVRDSVAERVQELEAEGMQIVELDADQIAEFAAIADEIWESQESVFGAEVLDRLRSEADAALEEVEGD